MGGGASAGGHADAKAWEIGSYFGAVAALGFTYIAVADEIKGHTEGLHVDLSNGLPYKRINTFKFPWENGNVCSMLDYHCHNTQKGGAHGKAHH